MGLRRPKCIISGKEIKSEKRKIVEPVLFQGELRGLDA